MSPALSVSEFRVLVGLLGDRVEREQLADRNVHAMDSLAQKGLATWGPPMLTDRGRAYVAFMQALPLPTATWTLPPFAPEALPTMANGGTVGCATTYVASAPDFRDTSLADALDRDQSHGH